MKRSTSAFTIVELLIVIVVIAILAAITIVAYNGIQSRANDAALQSDLVNFGKRLSMMTVESGNPPAGGAVRTGGVDTGNNTTFPGVTYAPTKTAYFATQNNLYYCTGVETATGQTSFRIVAKSKSGTTYSYMNGSIANLGTSVVPVSTQCLTPYGNEGSWTYGLNGSNGLWHSWAT